MSRKEESQYALISHDFFLEIYLDHLEKVIRGAKR